MTPGTVRTISRMTSRAPGTVMVTSIMGMPPWATSSTAKRASSADEVLIEGTRPTSSTRFLRSSLFMAEALPKGPAGGDSRRRGRIGLACQHYESREPKFPATAVDVSREWRMIDSGKRWPKNMSPRKRKAGKPKVSARKKKPTAKKVKPSRASTSKKRTANIKTRGKASTAEGISARVGVDSESVEELLAEGQSFEAEVVNGVENAPDPDQGEVRTRQLPEDDVPEEYRERD